MRNYLKTKGKELKLTTLGFTLIELLAVIVVLAIIALIATPIVMNTIKAVEKGAMERSAENYLKQVETTIALKRMDGIRISDGEYTINKNGNICLNQDCTELLEIEVNGNQPNGGKIEIIDKEVKSDNIVIKIGDYIVDFKENKLDAWIPYQGIICKANTKKPVSFIYDGKNAVSEDSSYINEEVGLLASEVGPYTLGVSYTCELGDGEEKTFFVLEESDESVSLIMNSNLNAKGKTIITKEEDHGKVLWCSKEDYLASGGLESDWNDGKGTNLGPITANKYLKSSTTSWTRVNLSQISLPTYDQIKIINKQNKWLYGNLQGNITGVAYYTSSINEVNNLVYAVGSNGTIFGRTSHQQDNSIRPVITLFKYQLG